jgi:hypothetical protein
MKTLSFKKFNSDLQIAKLSTTAHFTNSPLLMHNEILFTVQSDSSLDFSFEEPFRCVTQYVLSFGFNSLCIAVCIFTVCIFFRFRAALVLCTRALIAHTNISGWQRRLKPKG